MIAATLIGACGLALAGTVLALAPESVSETSARIPAAEIAAHRNAQMSRPAFSGRSLLHAQRGATYVFEDTFDGIGPIGSPTPGNYNRLTSLAPLSGEILAGQPNPDGMAWQSVAWGGIVSNAVAQSNIDGDAMNGEYNGPAGGPDPTGVRGGLLHVQRASINDAPVDEGSGIETYEFFTGLYSGTADKPLFVEIDLYKPTHETFQWIRPISYTEGVFLGSILFGGFQSGGLFQPLAQLFGDPEVIEGVVIHAEISKDSGEFVTSPKEISEGGWFTFGLWIDPGVSMAMFVRDAETLEDADMDGAPDWKTPMNTVTGLRMFEEYGYGLEEGWASVYPGTLDDPMTTDIEGAGYAVNGNAQPARHFLSNGNEVTRIYAGVSFDAMRLYHGSDPLLDDDPDYEMKDWWWDHVRVRGVPLAPLENPPAYAIPYTDDMERWNEGLVALTGHARWSAGRSNDAQFTALHNHTPPPGSGDGSPSQSLRVLHAGFDDSLNVAATSSLPATPRVRGLVGDPASVSVSLRLESSLDSYGVNVQETGAAVRYADSYEVNFHDEFASMARLWTSCIDATGVSDGRVHVRQRKPVGTDIAGGEYNPLALAVTAAGPNRTDDQEATINTEFLNVLAAPAGQADFMLPTDQWCTFRFWGEPDAGGARGASASPDPHVLRVFVSVDDTPFVELFPNGDATQSFYTGSIAPNALSFSAYNAMLAGNSSLYIDDVHLDGPTQTDTIVPLSAEFADDPAWELPFADPLDTYETNRPASPQGYANHRSEFLPTNDPDTVPTEPDWERIELSPGAAPLVNGDAVRVYEIISVDEGAPGFIPGDIIAVREPAPGAHNPDANIFGVYPTDPNDEPTEWNVTGPSPSNGTWFLATEDGAFEFDDTMMVDSGWSYRFRLEPRFNGAGRENQFVSAAEEGIDFARDSRGDVVKLTNRGNTRDVSNDNTHTGFSELTMLGVAMPLATLDDAHPVATVAFDMYVGQDQSETGLHVEINGGTADGGSITALSFGGLGFQSANASFGEFPPTLPLGVFGRLVPNLFAESGQPATVWEDTGVAVPTQQWFRVEVDLNRDSVYTIRIDGAELVSGVAIDGAEPLANTTSLDGLSFVRNMFGERDGRPTPGRVRWTPYAFNTPAPVGGPGAYHYYRIVDGVDPEPGQSLPQLWPVDGATGAPWVDMMGQPVTRSIQSTDVIAIVNADPTSGLPYADPFIAFEWEATDPSGVTPVATGTWAPIGLANSAGSTLAPAGGIPQSAPPGYNTMAPFEDILLGEYDEVNAPTLAPSDVWYIDNIALDSPFVSPCTADLASGDNQVNSADLAVLLAAWGTAHPQANLDGIGVVDSGDLAVLLAAWGPCPTR